MAIAPKKDIDWKAVFGAAVFVGGLMWAAHHELGSIGDRITAVD